MRRSDECLESAFWLGTISAIVYIGAHLGFSVFWGSFSAFVGLITSPIVFGLIFVFSFIFMMEFDN